MQTNHTRRRFLRSAGVCIALPTLEALTPTTKAAQTSPTACRMVCIGNEFGMFPEAFWPQGQGTNYELSPLLEPLQHQRKNLTVFSHLDHDLKGGHFAVHTFLTGVKSADAKSLPDGGVSLDQRAAEFVGSQTRFGSLTIGSESGLHGGPMMSWTRTGTRVPPVTGPKELFRKLFVNDSETSKQHQSNQIDLQDSILDAVLGHARSLKKEVSQADGQKLDEFFASIRDVERKLDLDRKWQNISKPQAPIDEPENLGLAKDLPALYDLILLALQTDSTRVATLEIGGSFAASDLGIRQGYHGLSHHGHVQASIDLLVQIERYQTEQFARFLTKLEQATVPSEDGSLLDNTMVLFGSGMGNANSHTNRDLPVILAGGGFRHGQHLQFPSASNQRVPLCNLFVSMLQRFGVETERFSNSTGTLRGFEVV